MCMYVYTYIGIHVYTHIYTGGGLLSQFNLQPAQHLIVTTPNVHLATSVFCRCVDLTKGCSVDVIINGDKECHGRRV